MSATPNDSIAAVIDALSANEASTRLKAALAAGCTPASELAEVLLARCAVESDFFVRDTLTWALTRLPSELTVPRLLDELNSSNPQARSQALHTLSKIKDPASWPAITVALLRDNDDEVARSAWRAAVILVPEEEKATLAAELASQLGRGDRNMQSSLSRALVALGAEVASPVLHQALTNASPKVRAHAQAAQRLLEDPDSAFSVDIDQAKRIYVLGKDAKA